MHQDSKIPQITATELAAALESGTALQVLDVRAPQRLAAGRIDTPPSARFLNLPNSLLFSLPDPELAGLDRSIPVAAVCGHGHSSMQTAAVLLQQGYQVRSLAGGMAAWMQLAWPRELTAPAGFSRLLQFDRLGKGALGYLLISAGRALVIDPPRDYSAYVAAAEETGARIAGVLDTHVHADYISGAPELARLMSTPYYLHPADNVYPFDGRPGALSISQLSDGQEIEIGKGKVRVMHTPGHTEGSVCVLAGDSACFSGDFVFIDSLGRPDLAGRSAEWTPQLWASLERARREWPAAMQIYPAHYSSDEERNADRTVGRSFGELLGSNSALGLRDAAGFSAWVESHVKPAPEAYPIIKAINIGLTEANEEEMEFLEAGRNECAVK